MNNNSDIVITGSWDGQPIWRKRTAQEKLAYEVWKNEQERNKEAVLTELEQSNDQ